MTNTAFDFSIFLWGFLALTVLFTLVFLNHFLKRQRELEKLKLIRGWIENELETLKAEREVSQLPDDPDSHFLKSQYYFEKYHYSKKSILIYKQRPISEFYSKERNERIANWRVAQCLYQTAKGNPNHALLRRIEKRSSPLMIKPMKKMQHLIRWRLDWLTFNHWRALDLKRQNEIGKVSPFRPVPNFNQRLLKQQFESYQLARHGGRFPYIDVNCFPSRARRG